MRVVYQRVSRAAVTADGELTGTIGKGALLLVGVGKEDTDEEKSYLLWIILAAAAVLLLVIIIIIAARRRKPPVAPTGFSVLMTFEVVSGNCKTKLKEFYLTDQLTIGRDRKCDIVFADEAVSGVNTRIFFKDGFIFIEDLGSSHGTALEGMRNSWSAG